MKFEFGRRSYTTTRGRSVPGFWNSMTTFSGKRIPSLSNVPCGSRAKRSANSRSIQISANALPRISGRRSRTSSRDLNVVKSVTRSYRALPCPRDQTPWLDWYKCIFCRLAHLLRRLQANQLKATYRLMMPVLNRIATFQARISSLIKYFAGLLFREDIILA